MCAATSSLKRAVTRADADAPIASKTLDEVSSNTNRRSGLLNGSHARESFHSKDV